jgi:hypothetical protein
MWRRGIAFSSLTEDRSSNPSSCKAFKKKQSWKFDPMYKMCMFDFKKMIWPVFNDYAQFSALMKILIHIVSITNITLLKL